jgi:poly(glycerol-phosphate) alpha-glucosyltransferase
MLDADTRVINVYEYFQKTYAEGLENKAVYKEGEDEAEETDVEKFYTGYMGCLRMVRYYKNGKMDKDLVYDDWGYLNYIREYSSHSEDVYSVKYYTTAGKVCLEAFFRPTNLGIEHEKIILYNDKSEVEAECKNSAELAALCLERIMSDDKFYILVIEDGLMSKAAAMINDNKKNAAKCIVVHNIFLNDAYKPESGAQTYYKYLCENHDKFDGIIMLTEDAREDFKKLYGRKNGMFVVPHPYPYEINPVEFRQRDNKKAVVVARLDPFKQIHLAVEVFALVVRELPDAKLEIYGRGPEEERIRGIIKKHRLENNVFLMGYTDEPLGVFNTAVLSMMTSRAEGFGLTLMESICNGCPAFAYDIKYGPAEIIKDGETGFLFPRFDAKMFASKMVAYFQDTGLQKQMSENCYAAAPGFSTDKFMENWYDLTENLYGHYITHAGL